MVCVGQRVGTGGGSSQSSQDTEVHCPANPSCNNAVQYYKRASNLGWFGHLHWAMYWSSLRTLAVIHKTTATAMRRKYSAVHCMRDGSVKRVLKATKPRPNGGPEYVAVFGDVSLKTDRFAPIQDGPF